MENDPFIDDFPIKTSIYKGFSMAMLNNQMGISGGMSIAAFDDCLAARCFMMFQSFPRYWWMMQIVSNIFSYVSDHGVQYCNYTPKIGD